MGINMSSVLAGTALLGGGIGLAAAEKPNIVYILADDLGYGDVKCNNPEGKILTPNIDALAAQGERFTDAHAAASVCTPSRYALLTGRYSWRTRLKEGVLKTAVASDPDEKSGCEPLISKDVMTVGEFLQKNGYSTAIFGKWHLGLWYKFPEGKTIIKAPNHGAAAPVGTEVIEGPLARGFDVFKGYHHAREMGTWIDGDKVVENITPDQMLAHIADAAVAYLNQPERKKKPFFMYIPLNSPHSPVVPTKEWQGKSGINVYADYVMETDAAVGKIIAALDKAGLKENTLVFFTSDNGCSPKAKFNQLLKAGHNPSYIFRGAKADIWEGGHRVPFIVRWPAVVKPGSVCKDPVCLTSLLATAADILDVKLPENAGVDSFSILPDLKNPDNEKPTHKIIIHQSIKGFLAIRDGKWKFIAGRGSGGWRKGGDEKPLQLYDMKKDVGEQNNIVDSQPEVVSKLKEELESAVKDGVTVSGKTGENDSPVEIYHTEKKERKKKKDKKKHKKNHNKKRDNNE